MDTEREILKIRGLLAEVAGVVWGDMVKRDNGLRGRVLALEAYRKEAEDEVNALGDRLRHYLDAERRETCLGLAELARREAAGDEEEEETEVEVAKIQAGAGASATRLQVVAMIVGAALNLIGLIGVALITRGAP